MNLSEQKKVLKSVKSFIEKHIKYTDDISYRTGDDAVIYSEFASKDAPFVSFEGTMYDYLNYGTDGWKFSEKLSAFLEKKGLYYEQGHAWNMSIYKI